MIHRRKIQIVVPRLTVTKRSAASHSCVLVAVLVTAEIKFSFRSYVNVFATALFVAWVRLLQVKEEHWLLSGGAMLVALPRKSSALGALTLPPLHGCSPSPREGRAGRGTGRGKGCPKGGRGGGSR